MATEPILERNENSIREKGCWSDNVAEGYENALTSCLCLLTEAAGWLDPKNGVVNATNAEKAMKRAQKWMNEANTWFNRANNQSFRIQALTAEIKALRSGVAITYPEGEDPLAENWQVKR